MKTYNYLFLLIFAAVFISCDDKDNNVNFGVDQNSIEIGAEGGVRNIRISSGNDWTAQSDDPWITISPANGRGSTDCEIIIDSALHATHRNGAVVFRNLQTNENREVTVTQGGFEYSIIIEDNDIEIENYAAYGKRNFDVTINTNVDFDIKIPAEAQKWLSYDKEKFKVDLDRGSRPRDVVVRFEWTINSLPEGRSTEVTFEPKNAVTLTRQDKLQVTQEAAEPVIPNTRSADSIALLALARNMNMSGNWENSGEAMDYWNGVQLWEESDEGYTPDKEGRVRYARFYQFNTNEEIPFEVQYLTAAEHLAWYGNGNKFLKDLSTGEHLCKLTQLRRLEIGSYGLVELHDDFVNLKELESLDLGGNNFQTVPAILTPENFPKLRALYLNTNQRRVISDLSGTYHTEFGGLFDEGGIPVRLLKWNLDTLTLNVNYMGGPLPTFEGQEWADWPKYTAEDIAASNDTLPSAMIGTPKVMPNTMSFRMGLNRFYGELPFWILYHPALDWWGLSNVINQEGTAADGTKAGFSNEPFNLRYYYDFYDKKRNPYEEID